MGLREAGFSFAFISHYPALLLIGVNKFNLPGNW